MTFATNILIQMAILIIFRISADYQVVSFSRYIVQFQWSKVEDILLSTK